MPKPNSFLYYCNFLLLKLRGWIPSGLGRMFCVILTPLRKSSYAVCLSLIEHGKAQAIHTHSNNCAVPLDVSLCDI